MQEEDLMNDEEKSKKKYDVALATRNFEIELFWKRSVFFWGFIASSFVGYSALISKDNPTAIFIACFGFVCSVAWSLVNRGSKYWQENWESIIGKIEEDVTGNLFKHRGEQKKKGIWLTSRKFSVSKVTIALSDFTIIIWMFLIGYQLSQVLSKPLSRISYLIVSIVIFSVIFSVIMICSARSSDA